jgi:hypothetical protein
MYRIEKKGIIKRWHWVLILSSYGMAEGQAWTKRGAERQLLMAQGMMLRG